MRQNAGVVDLPNASANIPGWNRHGPEYRLHSWRAEGPTHINPWPSVHGTAMGQGAHRIHSGLKARHITAHGIAMGCEAPIVPREG